MRSSLNRISAFLDLEEINN